jgi:hypothetical protein
VRDAVLLSVELSASGVGVDPSVTELASAAAESSPTPLSDAASTLLNPPHAARRAGNASR